MRPVLQVLLAIESYRSAAQIDPGVYDLRGPTARAVDRFLGLPEGKTRQLVQSLADRDFVLSLPRGRGKTQRLILTEAGRYWMEDGCPRIEGFLS
jgi:hypothetical protein